MTSDRRGAKPKQQMTRTVLGRYMRFSHRYNCWQVQTRDGTFKNVSVPMARCYAAAGFPVGVQPPARPLQMQIELNFGD